MKIDINQKAISIGDKYTIFINGNQEYFASLKLFTLLPVISLFSSNDPQPILVIKRRFSFLKPKFDITGNTDTCKFTTISLWQHHYQCIKGNDTYDIYEHTKRKCSIYKNDNQIAFWEHEMVSWLDGDNYSLYADNNCDKELLIALCLILDNYEHNDHNKSMVNIDVGNIGWGLKKFDSNWRPK
jgi:uncharacterized protein YxjI